MKNGIAMISKLSMPVNSLSATASIGTVVITNKKLSTVLEAAVTKKYPEINLNTNHVYTFEALLVAADAYKRAGSADPKALADAIRATNITDNVSIGPGIQFNDKGQNDKLKNAAIQNRGGKLLTIAPQTASNAKPELPMSPYDRRG